MPEMIHLDSNTKQFSSSTVVMLYLLKKSLALSLCLSHSLCLCLQAPFRLPRLSSRTQVALSIVAGGG